ncbi:electron transfer flavoprotein subunit beta/FixA family protein [Halanaerobium praevalens]|uniref:Electron transfer flavoprotein small subunit n=1 Tax=Halanaerobium praevalens (strain ATCC 33744 / DSM 2228 / GSL) TaxID=572479 RepID=E3DM12_HALPG|nr:electron transfer flavoprotein subunit beta/FixA family protein [Halanaerobium praevalens]ADO76271.1 Electron transfer flavoprotein alpha/beta-subunit [Halanaerobium praevalens DSM 2228]
MNILVCVKQVPDTDEVRIDEENGTLIRDGVPSIINPEDKIALEEAVRLKEEQGGKVTVISMGPPQAKTALLEAYAMGADECILVSDRAFAGSDTWATSYTLAQGIKNAGEFDIIFCGRQAIDGDTAQVGPQIAENLGMPQITYVRGLEVEGEKVKAKRALEDGYSVVETKMPVLLTVIDGLNKPRYPSIKRVVAAFKKEDCIKVWSTDDFEVDMSKLGLDASPTQVYDTFVPTNEKKGEFLEGNEKEKVEKLLEKLKLEQVL